MRLFDYCILFLYCFSVHFPSSSLALFGFIGLWSWESRMLGLLDLDILLFSSHTYP
ncbi:hypothetical protein CFIMG_008604RA00001 [Ceratocystis fimbriata CBS 114723]|uniref:Uncharacterized protein n=1 Tax=Ceratocystis fimbriata CBS 114723 TaxID=1035309 RepID=A0A2C5WZS7_9PEZI|nr:hypothetical protein CFIMG_008604RA00001 [Ceratocystis fimbriata CBS 114723]